MLKKQHKLLWRTVRYVTVLAWTCSHLPLVLSCAAGGSIRQPAHFCGVVGLKPSYGRVSRYGLIAYASSLDVVGPLAHTVYDAALMLNSLAGK